MFIFVENNIYKLVSCFWLKLESVHMGQQCEYIIINVYQLYFLSRF